MESIKLQGRYQRPSREWQIKIVLITILHNSLLFDRLTLFHFRFLLPFVFVLKDQSGYCFHNNSVFPAGVGFRILPSILVPKPCRTMSMTMRALRIGQMSIKSVSCYAAAQAPVFVRHHTPYNYSSPAKPKNLWEGLWNGFASRVPLISSRFHQSPREDLPLQPVDRCLLGSCFFRVGAVCSLRIEF